MTKKSRLRLQIIIINYLVPLFIGGVCREIIVSLFNIHMEKGVLERILFALNKPMVYGLMLFISTIINIIILSQLKPLFKFMDTGEMESKARKASLSTPWILILVHTLAWIIGTTALYAFVFKWNSPGGVKYLFSVLFSTSMGLFTAVMGALLLNIVLLPAKHQLKMVQIREGEKDSFIKIKYYLILVTVLITMGLTLFHASRFIANRNLSSMSGAIFAAFIAFFGIWAAVLIFLARKEDLYQARQMLERIQLMNSQEGDLSQFITLINFDDVGKISNDLNIFITKLKEIVTEINSESQILEKTGQNLSNHIQETSKSIKGNNNSLGIVSQEVLNYNDALSTSFNSIQKIFTGINSLKDSITEQAAGIEESGATINSMIKYTQKNSEVMKKMEAAFENLIQISQNGEKKINNLNQSLNEVLEQSTRLQETNKIISSIAARTNLLAMNAAIEAAHAANAGSGFAVVASEVRTLAENAARESSNVNNELNKTMELINGAAGDAEESLKSFHDIKEKISSAYDLEQNILRSFEEQNAGSQQVISALKEMNSISGSVQETASSLSSETEIVDKSIKNLDNISKNLGKDIKSLSSETESVSRRVEEMTQISQNNSENIKNIKASVTRFKIKN